MIASRGSRPLSFKIQEPAAHEKLQVDGTKGRLVFRHRLFPYCGDNKFRWRKADQHLHARHLDRQHHLAPNLCGTTTNKHQQLGLAPGILTSDNNEEKLSVIVFTILKKTKQKAEGGRRPDSLHTIGRLSDDSP